MTNLCKFLICLILICIIAFSFFYPNINEFKIIGLLFSSISILYLILVPVFIKGNFERLALFDLFFSMVTLLIVGYFFWNSGLEFKFFNFSLNWFWYYFLIYASLEYYFFKHYNYIYLGDEKQVCFQGMEKQYKKDVVVYTLKNNINNTIKKEVTEKFNILNKIFNERIKNSKKYITEILDKRKNKCFKYNNENVTTSVVKFNKEISFAASLNDNFTRRISLRSNSFKKIMKNIKAEYVIENQLLLTKEILLNIENFLKENNQYSLFLSGHRTKSFLSLKNELKSFSEQIKSIRKIKSVMDYIFGSFTYIISIKDSKKLYKIAEKLLNNDSYRLEFLILNKNFEEHFSNYKKTPYELISLGKIDDFLFYEIDTADYEGIEYITYGEHIKKGVINFIDI